MAKIITRNQLPYNLVDGIGVCYFDPETEKLKEFHSGLSLVVGPFETTVRRFYVVKPSALINGFTPMYSIISFRSISSDITFKIRLGTDRISNVEDFYDIEPNNELNIFFNGYPSGIIPIDVCIASHTNNNVISDMDVTLEVY